MELQTLISEYQKILENENLTCHGGNGTHAVLRTILDDICSLLTGFKNKNIDINTELYNYDKLYRFKYHVFNGGEFQYNYFYLDYDFKLVKIEGDAERQIEKIFSFL